MKNQTARKGALVRESAAKAAVHMQRLDHKAKVPLEVQEAISDLSESTNVAESRVAGFLAEIGIRIIGSPAIAAAAGSTVGDFLLEMTNPHRRPTTEGVIDVTLSIYAELQIRQHSERFRRPLDEWLGKIIAIAVGGLNRPAVWEMMARKEGLQNLLCKAASHDMGDEREGFSCAAPLSFLKFEKALREESKSGGEG